MTGGAQEVKHKLTAMTLMVRRRIGNRFTLLKDAGFFPSKRKTRGAGSLDRAKSRLGDKSSSFFEDVQSFKKVIAIWHPWDDAVLLNSIWCVWEIYVATRAGMNVVFFLSQSQRSDISEHLPNRFENLVDKVDDFQVENCQSYHRRQKKRILRAAAAEERNFNSKIKHIVLNFCLERALKTVQNSPKFSLQDKAYASLLPVMSFVSRKLGKVGQCLSLCEESLTLSKRLYGKETAEVARDTNNLAVVFKELGDNQLAIKLHFEALAIMKQLFGVNNIYVAQDINNLAALLAEVGRYDEAEELFEQSLNIKLDYYGPDHESVASGMTNLALLYQKIGKYAEAGELHRGALKIRVKSNLLVKEAAESSSYMAEVLESLSGIKRPSESEKLKSLAKGFVDDAFRFAKKSGDPELVVALEKRHGERQSRTSIA